MIFSLFLAVVVGALVGACIIIYIDSNQGR